jgi:hypothetical protein
MAKRVRGSSRPGRRRPRDRRAAPSAPSAPSAQPPTDTSRADASAAPGAAPARTGGLTDAELERAAQLEAAMVAEERAAEASRKRSQERLTAAREQSGPRDMNMAQEYAYVSRDLRDIGRIAVVMLTILFALWILIDVVGVVRIT